MDQRSYDQLEKVLAMADSAHAGEAVVAVRKARELLLRDGLRFGDLARAASTYKPHFNKLSIFSCQETNLETHVVQLRKKLGDLQAKIQAHDLQLGFWRRRVRELEQN